MSLIATHPATRYVQRQVSLLRQWLYLLLWVRGLALVVITLAGLTGLSLLLDWTFRFPRGQRVVILLAGLMLVGWMAYRRLLIPLGRKISDAQLAVWIESVYPHLRGRWLALIELREEEIQQQGASPALVGALLNLEEVQAQTTHWRKVLRPAYVTRVRGTALIAGWMVVMIVLAILLPGSHQVMSLWWQRNVMIRDVDWPTRTQLILPGDVSQPMVVPRGDDWILPVRVEGVAPARLTAELQMQTTRSSKTQRVELLNMGSGKHQLLVRNMLEPLKVRIMGGDAKSSWMQVELVERPQIETLSIKALPPAYTGLSDIEFPTGATRFAVPAGSRLRVTLAATSALAWAKLSHEDQEDVAFESQGSFWVGEVSSEVLRSGEWKLSLADARGLEARPVTRLSVDVQPDRPPTVQGELQGIGGLALARAVLPVQFSTRDDYGLGKAVVQGRWTSSDGSKPGETTFEQPVQTWTQPSIKEARGEFQLDLLGREIPVGAMLNVEVLVWDRDDVKGPNVGRSPSKLVKIVSEADLRADLLRREQEQRRELQTLIKDQQDLETEIRALGASRTQASGKVTGLESLMTLERRQRTLTDRVGVIHRHMDMLATEMSNNRLEDAQGPVLGRMKQRVLQPLVEVGQTILPGVLALLEQARAGAAGPESLTRLRQAAEAQAEAARKLRGVMEAMAYWASYQEAVQLLQDSLRMQNQVHEATRKEMEKRVRDLFDG